MTLKEKLRLIQGHAMGVTTKNTLTNGRYYNGETYPADSRNAKSVGKIIF